MLSSVQIQEIINTPINPFGTNDAIKGIAHLNTWGAILALIINDYENETYDYKEDVYQYIKDSFHTTLCISGEPAFDFGHNWGYPAMCQSIALMHNKESLWNIFDDDEKMRLDWTMKMFALMWNFGCNRFNSYFTGVGLLGNAGKRKSPNMRLSNNALILYIIPYLGGVEQFNDFVTNITYEEVITKLKELGWENAHQIWTTPGFDMGNGETSPGAKELFNTADNWKNKVTPVRAYRIDDRYGFPNIVNAGYGQGCTLPFSYTVTGKPEKRVDYPTCIYEDIIPYTFSGGECKSIIPIETEENFSARIIDLTTSRYEGQVGMMLEFNLSEDGFGRRSSPFHCEIDFYLISMMVATLKYLTGTSYRDLPDYEKMLVGMGDYLYKDRHGYIGYSLGTIEHSTSRFSLSYWKTYWKQLLQEG